MEFHIREARERAGYSQKELAEIIGVAPNTFHGYESGKHDPKSELLVKIAQACNVTVDFILGRESEAKKSPDTTEDVPGEDLTKIFNYLQDSLVAAGLLKKGQDLTERQADVLIAVCQIIHATFGD